MGQVRAFVETDIPKVARLHETVFSTSSRSVRPGLDPYAAYFTSIFFDNPSRDPALPSLVYEEDDGCIVGFLGVAPRRMSIDGQQLKGAIASGFVVDPTSRSAVVTVELARIFLDGPQDVSISDVGSDVVRTVWEGLGGATALLHSLHWTRPIRPAQLAVSVLRNRSGLASLALVADAPSRIVDLLATRLPRSHFFQSKPPASLDDLEADTLLARLPEFAAAGSLRVEYDGRTLQWLLDCAAGRNAGGTLEKAVIRNGQAVLGWYLYHLDRHGLADVLQIAAKPSSIHTVLDQLFYQAWRQGATAVTGRLEPRFLQALSDKYCFFHRRGPWTLVNARKREVLRSFQNGDAFFSRFDGAWCLGF